MRTVLLAMLSFAAASTAHAQFFATCDTAGPAELERSFRAYQEHNYRLAHKFLDGYYLQGELPEDFGYVELDAIVAGLAAEESRRSALLFHAYSGYAFCAWLVTPERIVGAATRIGGDDYESLVGALREALGVAAAEQSRSPRRRGVQPGYREAPTRGDPDVLLAQLGDVLIPPPVHDALQEGGIDSLLVTPLASTATLPLAALPVDPARRLVDVASIALLAEPAQLTRPASTRPARMQPAVVAGDPVAEDEEWEFPPLPGARAEADAVARRLGTEALLGGAATREALVRRIEAEPSLAMIYLATHGVASTSNPLDASFLLLADARWPAAEIQNLALRGHPLVVLSACQTGLGKDFDVGTMGMARAWARAGAAEVVMSLWNVDDDATRELMLEFIDAAAALPADQALRQAMLARRRADPDVARWASFAVLGRPGLPASPRDADAGRWSPDHDPAPVGHRQ